MQNLKRLLPLFFGLMLLVQGAFAQPDPIQNLGGDWVQPQPKLQIWFTANQDTAWVANPTETSGEFWGVRFEDKGYARCPDVSFFNTATLLYSGVNQNFSLKMTCLEQVRTNIDTLTSSLNYTPPETFAESECKTKQYNAIDNVTVHIPDNVAANVKESGDVIFAYDKKKNCVGYTADGNWPNTFPVAGNWELEEFGDWGYQDGESIKFALYDSSEDQVRPLGYGIADAPEGGLSEIYSDGDYIDDEYIQLDTLFITSTV